MGKYCFNDQTVLKYRCIDTDSVTNVELIQCTLRYIDTLTHTHTSAFITLCSFLVILPRADLISSSTGGMVCQNIQTYTRIISVCLTIETDGYCTHTHCTVVEIIFSVVWIKVILIGHLCIILVKIM